MKAYMLRKVLPPSPAHNQMFHDTDGGGGRGRVGLEKREGGGAPGGGAPSPPQSSQPRDSSGLSGTG